MSAITKRKIFKLLLKLIVLMHQVFLSYSLLAINLDINIVNIEIYNKNLSTLL